MDSFLLGWPIFSGAMLLYRCLARYIHHAKASNHRCMAKHDLVQPFIEGERTASTWVDHVMFGHRVGYSTSQKPTWHLNKKIKTNTIPKGKVVSISPLLTVNLCFGERYQHYNSMLKEYIPYIAHITHVGVYIKYRLSFKMPTSESSDSK